MIKVGHLYCNRLGQIHLIEAVVRTNADIVTSSSGGWYDRWTGSRMRYNKATGAYEPLPQASPLNLTMETLT